METTETMGRTMTATLLHMQRHIVRLEAEVEALKAGRTESVPPARAGYGLTALRVFLPASLVRVLHQEAAMRDVRGDAVKNAVVDHLLTVVKPHLAQYVGLERELSKTDPLGGFDITATLLVGLPK